MVCSRRSRSPWELKEDWIEAERERFAFPASPGTGSSAFGAIGRPFHEVLTEPRSEEAYRQEVDTYLEHADCLLEAEVIRTVIEDEAATVELQIENQTEKNFDGVQVVLELPAGPTVWRDAGEASSALDAPPPPQPWGQEHRIASERLDLSGIAFRDGVVEIDRREDGTTVRFGSEHVRPLAVVSLPILHVVLWEDPGEVEIRWRLTSSGVDGQTAGVITCQVADKPMELAMNKPQES